MKRVRKFGIWARSELGIEHDVRRAFRTGSIRTWERNRAVKTNRFVRLFVTSRSFTETVKRRITQTTPNDSPRLVSVAANLG